MKILDLSADAIGVPRLDMINIKAFLNVLSKYGRYITQIIYKKGNQEFHASILYVLPFHITIHCLNVTSLEFTASIINPWGIEVLAENCKKLKQLRLKLCIVYDYKDELTKLFEENKNLENIVLYDMGFLCPSLKKLPEHKMKAITVQCIHMGNDIFSSVSTIRFFFILFSEFVYFIYVDQKCNTIYSRITDTRKSTKLEIFLDNYYTVKRWCIPNYSKKLQKSRSSGDQLYSASTF